MKLRGVVTSKEGFLSLLRALSESQATGALVVTDRDAERRLFFENGEIVATASSVRRESFGFFLVEQSLIDERALSDVEEQQKNDSTALFGQRLVDFGVMSELDVESALRLKIKKTILDIYSVGGNLALVGERLGEQRRVEVLVDARELMAGEIEAELGKGPTPVFVAQKAVSKPLIRVIKPPSLGPPSRGHHETNVGGFSPAFEGIRRPTDLSDAIARSVQWASDSRRDPLRFLLTAVGCIIAGLALSIFTLGLVQNSTERGPQNLHRRSGGTAKANVEASISSEPVESSPKRTGALPSERESEIAGPEVAVVATEKTDRSPTFQPTRAEVEASPETPAAESSSSSEPRVDENSPKVDTVPEAKTDGGNTHTPAGLPVPEMNPEPVVERGDLVESAFDVIEPVLLEMPELHYPKDARRRRLEAVVRVRVLVDENGRVLKAELEDFVGHGFDEAALGVAVRTQFIPATKGTVPVKMWTTLPVVYRLEKK